MQMSSELDKTDSWFLSSSPSPEIHIFLPPEVLSNVSALPDQIIKYVLNHLNENYPLFECSCSFTVDNALKIIINNAHILGEKIVEINGVIDFPEIKEEIRSDISNLLSDIQFDSHIVGTIEVTAKEQEELQIQRNNVDMLLALEDKITYLNETCKHIFKDGEIFSLNANGKSMDCIYIYNARWEPIIKFNIKTHNSYIQRATNIIFKCKEDGFSTGSQYITKENLLKDKFGFAIQHNLNNEYFLGNDELRSQIINASKELKALDPQEHLVGNPDAIALNAFKDGFAVGTFLRSQSLIDSEKYGVTPNYF